jgi:tyrosinase
MKGQCRKDFIEAKELAGVNYLDRYWNEALDVANFTNSPIFDPKTGFGGDGVNPTRCIADGPFANITLHFKQDLTTTNYCVIRNLNECPFQGAAQSVLDACLATKTFEEAWHCIEARPHAAGHAGVGGIVSSKVVTPDFTDWN